MSRHRVTSVSCPLFLLKRTFINAVWTSVKCQKRTLTLVRHHSQGLHDCNRGEAEALSSDPGAARGDEMKTALTIFVLLAILAGAIWVGHYGWESAGDVVMPAWGWLMMGLGIFFTLLVGGGLMALVFYSSRAGFDEPPEVVQEKKHRAAKWGKMIPGRKKRRSS